MNRTIVHHEGAAALTVAGHQIKNIPATIKLGVDIHQEFYVVVAQHDHALPQPPAEPEAKAARFIDREDCVPAPAQLLDPGHELLRPQTPRRLRQSVIVLRDHHVKLLVNVYPELDRRGDVLNLVTGDRECGRPFVMNDCSIHKAGELPRSPAPFHAIYALQRTAPAVTA